MDLVSRNVFLSFFILYFLCDTRVGLGQQSTAIWAKIANQERSQFSATRVPGVGRWCGNDDDDDGKVDNIDDVEMLKN